MCALIFLQHTKRKQRYVHWIFWLQQTKWNWLDWVRQETIRSLYPAFPSGKRDGFEGTEEQNKHTVFLSESPPLSLEIWSVRLLRWGEWWCEQSTPCYCCWINLCRQQVSLHYKIPFFPFPTPILFTQNSLHRKVNSRFLLHRIGIRMPKFPWLPIFPSAVSPLARLHTLMPWHSSTPETMFGSGLEGRWREGVDLWSVTIIVVFLIHERWENLLMRLLCRALWWLSILFCSIWGALSQL